MNLKFSQSIIPFSIIVFFICFSVTNNFIIALVITGLVLLIINSINGNISFETERDNEKLQYVYEILALISIVFNADNKILKSELNYVKRFLNNNYSEQEARAYLLKFREYTKMKFSIDKICRKIDYELDSAGKRQILHVIIGAAVADRELTKQELIIIYTIGKKLSISKITIDSLLSMHNFNYSDQQQYYQNRNRSSDHNYNRRTSSSNNLAQAYKILEIMPTASEVEVKKAYRKLAVIYHPDKVMNMGEKHQKSAKEKFQKIQGAYEQIKEARGIK